MLINDTHEPYSVRKIYSAFFLFRQHGLLILLSVYTSEVHTNKHTHTHTHCLFQLFLRREKSSMCYFTLISGLLCGMSHILSARLAILYLISAYQSVCLTISYMPLSLSECQTRNLVSASQPVSICICLSECHDHHLVPASQPIRVPGL